MGRQVKGIDQLGKETLSEYDANGHLSKVIDRNGNQTRHVYNYLGLAVETQVFSPDNKPLNDKTYTYNTMGETLSSSENGLTLSFTYDELGRLVEEKENRGIVKKYSYDNRGNKQSFILSKDGTKTIATTYVYDKQDRLVKVLEDGTLTAQYTYDANGNRATLTGNNGIVTTYTYNDGNLVVSLTNRKGNAIVSSYQYTYYMDGN